MTRSLATALAALRGRRELAALKRGIEKESLRVTPDGELAQTAHPVALGSPLTHPHITTDFSEAQLELITGVHDSADAALAELFDVHAYVHSNIGNEMLWAASMPCLLGREADIPIARFGDSNAGRSKLVYRIGLSHRYGRRMQAVSGIHYNFSLPDALWPALAASRGESADRDFVTRAYLGLIRNFRRCSWLLIYLFGASPAVCKSFVAGVDSGLRALDEGTLYLPDATSLRMGRLGYQSAAQSSVSISFNSLEQYATTMRPALETPYPPYEAIGLRARSKTEEDEYRQLSTALLQIENEFYGVIRPKRRTRAGERPLTALRERGIEYVEVRSLDLDPFQPLGIDGDRCRFLDVFLLRCLLEHSPAEDVEEPAAVAANQLAVVERGRQAGLKLSTGAAKLPLAAWAEDILDACEHVAQAIDEAAGDDRHVSAVAQQRRKVANAGLTPSARILAAMRDGAPFFRFALEQSAAHRAWFRQRPLAAGRLAELDTIGERSLRDQARAENADSEDFDAYLRRYMRLPET